MFKKNKIIKVIFIFFFLPSFFSYFQILAQTSPAQERQALEEELKRLEGQIAQYEENISKTEQEKKTLQSQISVLKQKIAKLNLQIRQSNTMIKDLGIQIDDTKGSIDKTAVKIKDSRSHLAGVLKAVNEEDQKSLLEILLSEKELSDFFDNLMALETLNSKAQALLSDIKDLKIYLENQKQSLEDEKGDLEKVLKIQVLQKKDQETAKKDKDYFLQLTETQYQEYLKGKKEVEKKAAEIRARIFELVGVPEAPTFGQAYELAKEIAGITLVRPALLLAVLTQESNIGKNVGQCYLKNTSTGEGVVAYNGKNVSNVMKPSRDVGPFLEITGVLGRDPFNTPVSCPMSFGWGGAMGPAQFIPSTWIIYDDRVKGITGKTADPWAIRDAFLAAAFYLADYGAKVKTYNSEWKAAMIYFSGSTNTRYRFYGDSVMNIAKQYEDDIKEIEGLQ